MALKPSYYNHYTVANDPSQTIVLNKYCGSIAVIDSATARCVQDGEIERISAGDLSELAGSGFLVPEDTDEQDLAELRYLRSKETNSTLSIIIELTQTCNLACTYCYQNSYRQSDIITEDTTAGVMKYIEAVIGAGKRPITDVIVGFIGGEPLLQKKKVLATIDDMAELTDRLGVRFHTQIDTNGLLLDEGVVRALDIISVTLSNKADHDTVRVRHNGSGSHDQILKRLRSNAPHFNSYDTQLSIRYNANFLNAKYMPEVYRTVRELGIAETKFELYNTINYTYNQLIPGLSREQFKALYLQLIKLKFEHGEIITDFPRPTFSTCSAYTPYNLKIAADGRLALCDAFTTPISSLDHLLESIDNYEEIFSKVVNYNPFNDDPCASCADVGICGGKVYCKSTPDALNGPEPRDFLSFDMDDFLRFFAEAYPTAPHQFQI